MLGFACGFGFDWFTGCFLDLLIWGGGFDLSFELFILGFDCVWLGVVIPCLWFECEVVEYG